MWVSTTSTSSLQASKWFITLCNWLCTCLSLTATQATLITPRLRTSWASVSLTETLNLARKRCTMGLTRLRLSFRLNVSCSRSSMVSRATDKIYNSPIQQEPSSYLMPFLLASTLPKSVIVGDLRSIGLGRLMNVVLDNPWNRWGNPIYVKSIWR